MRKHVYVIGHGSPSHESLVSSHESTFNVCVRITSVPLVSPFLSRAKHVLGRGPNTTPSLCQPATFDAVAYNRGRFARVCFVNGGNGSNWVSCPECRIDHALPSLLVIAVLFRYLFHANTQPSSRDPMVIILPYPVPCRDIRSRSDARN